MKFGLNVGQNLVTLDAWELFGSFEDISVQLQYLRLGGHTVCLAYVPEVGVGFAFFAFT